MASPDDRAPGTAGGHDHSRGLRENALVMEETLAAESGFYVRRRGRFLIVELRQPHRVLSTSAHGGGQRDDLRYLVNHQSCEGRGHQARFLRLKDSGRPGTTARPVPSSIWIPTPWR